jgi:transposase
VEGRWQKTKAWEVTDEFWSRVEPLIPVRQRSCRSDLHHEKAAVDANPKIRVLVFEGIVFVLRTGCQWKALPAERYGSASAIHARFLEWEKAGVFEALWKLGLAEYDEFEGIAWRWQSIDGAMMKAPMASAKRWSQPDGSGEKMGASAICWWTVVASRCRSS